MSGLMLVGGAYALMSCVTFIAYVLDKRAAVRHAPRTSEMTLHVLELCCGWPGAFAAQQLIRHKNAKVGYQVIFWMIVMLHVAAWIIAMKWSPATYN